MKQETQNRRIRLLDEQTIGKIAAGEVAERPSAVAKELIENAIDAGTDAITCEVAEGGVKLLRVTDNGCGIWPEDIRAAFMRHATSKISDATDLNSLYTLGFRGEALASIAAVARVEMITKRRENAYGIRAENAPVVRTGDEAQLQIEEVGAPDGTSIIVRDLFYNVPVRRSFLKSAVTEAGYITDMIEHLSLSHPDISFHYRVNGKDKLHTTGNGDVREIIYRIFGKETHDGLLPVDFSEDGFLVQGFVGRPQISRASRQAELFFLNGRSIESDVLSKALEEGYRTDLMQHRFPFAVLYLEIPPDQVDVNIHPAKREVRFAAPDRIYDILYRAVLQTLERTELIRRETLADAQEERAARRDKEAQGELLARTAPNKEPYLAMRREKAAFSDEGKASLPAAGDADAESSFFADLRTHEDVPDPGPDAEAKMAAEESIPYAVRTGDAAADMGGIGGPSSAAGAFLQEEFVFTAENAPQFRLIGQVFRTYWIIEFRERLLLIDQHAAHEKVNFECIMGLLREREGKPVPSQLLSPPVMVQLSGREETALLTEKEAFWKLGYEFEEMGGGAFALRGVPLALYNNDPAGLLRDTIDEILEEKRGGTPKDIVTHVATMSCKAAVKGNRLLSEQEARALIGELLALENPYHCPHGRPTMIELKK
ncbi:MAG: DNA mismatch repair endonuclease MutL, partial [Lachnospiraceae bacterium]|nr:DNA mismatch repair endonuclease MutL [Lachnospiraceae bacterium]